MIEIVAIDTPSLGDRGYLATDGQMALVVDAQRDFDRVTTLAAERGVTITHVFETHIHNDYVTGGLALARAAGAEYMVNGADPVGFRRTPVQDGDVLEIGAMHVRVVSTPGHTFTHLCYVLQDEDDVLAAFTGGSLLNGSTGRTDLLGARFAETLGRAQYGSAARLASELPGLAAVCPTHGFGSFCAASPGTGEPSTIADERRTNPALTLTEPEYVSQLLAGLDAYPAYYAHMAPANQAGPAEPNLVIPRQAKPAELRQRIDAGEWVVDMRSRAAFAAGHVRGTLNFEAGTSLPTYLGWLMPHGMPLTLIGDSPADVAAAQRQLCRIGIDQIAAAAAGPIMRWAAGEELEAFRLADFGALAIFAGKETCVVVDVRLRTEWASGHIDGAVHIPLHELQRRMAELPDGQVWVHCQAGYRAAVAASMLAAAGRDVVAIEDDFAAAAGVGLVAASVARS